MFRAAVSVQYRCRKGLSIGPPVILLYVRHLQVVLRTFCFFPIMERTRSSNQGLIVLYRWPEDTPFAELPLKLSNAMNECTFTATPAEIYLGLDRGKGMLRSPEHGTALLLLHLSCMPLRVLTDVDDLFSNGVVRCRRNKTGFFWLWRIVDSWTSCRCWTR